jgi:hypothetical protein
LVAAGRPGRALGAAAGALLLAPGAARACAVCYGAASDPVLDGSRWSVVFLLVLTYLLLGGGGVLFVLARRSARRAAAADRGALAARDASTEWPDRDASMREASTRGLV